MYELIHVASYKQNLLALALFVSVLCFLLRWKVQVASKGVYFRKPKVSLIIHIKHVNLALSLY